MPEEKKVDTPEKLQEWIDNTEKVLTDLQAKNAELETAKEELSAKIEEKDAEIGRIREDMQPPQIITGGYKDNPENPRHWDYQLGKWLGAVTRRDHKQLGEFDTKMLITRKSQPDYEKVISVKELSEKALEKQVKADLGTPLTGDATGTDAQYLIPQTIYEETILRTLMVQSEVIPKFTRVTMRGRLHRYPVESTAFSLTFVTNEVTSKTEKFPTWTYEDLEAETYAGWVGVTDELMEDTFADIGGQLRLQAVEAYQDTVETQLLNGSGSPVTGVLQDTGANDLVISGSGFEDVSWDDCQDLIETLTSKKKRNGAVFTMHPTVWDGLANAKDAQGSYYWNATQATQRGIKGYPVLLSDNTPDLSDSAVSTAFIAFGNLRYVLYGIRMGLEIKYFNQTMYAVQDDENFFRIRTRFAGVVGLPGNFAVMKTAAA